MSILALSWFEHRRTTELCKGLGVELSVLSTRQRGLVRYVILACRTTAVLLQRRPKVVLLQNPSLISAVLALCLRPVLRYRLIVDAHNQAVEPFLYRSKLIVSLTRWVLRAADLTIVTNHPLARVVERSGGKAFVLPDRIPTPPAVGSDRLPGSFNVALIATFAGDEPYREVLDAVQGMELTLFVTGNHTKLPTSLRESVPPNVRFTGFLSEPDYWELLSSVDAVIDLTTMDNCLVCGAYEAIAVSKPLVLSRNEASVGLFGDCALFTDNSVADIRATLNVLPAVISNLQDGARLTRVRMTRQWDESAAQLRRLMLAGL